jgi:inner membrane protein
MSKRKPFLESHIFKILVIAGLLLLFLIPLQMIKRIVYEREQRSEEAAMEIAGLWGGGQSICGPFISVPYRYFVKETDREGTAETRTVLSRFFFLPESLEIQSSMTSEIRSRGIYDVPVYQAGIKISGVFSKPDPEDLHIKPEDIFWDEAKLVVELPDIRAVQSGTSLLWDENPLELSSGYGRAGFYPGSLESDLPRNWQEEKRSGYFIRLELRGAGSLRFIPFGKQTRVHLTADWPSPSFSGSYLPAARELSDQGFTADWSVHVLARNFPQAWKQGDLTSRTVLESAFGFDLFMPVDPYAKAERSLKYGVLFVFLPFLAFFLFEVFTKNRLHILHYLMVGGANTVFYLLLLSLSEHIGFGPAYGAAAAVTTGLIVFYAASILALRRQGLTMLPVMGGLYLFLYTALQSEDYALLIGSVGLFLVLAAVMVLTRKVDWNRLGGSLSRSAGS